MTSTLIAKSAASCSRSEGESWSSSASSAGRSCSGRRGPTTTAVTFGSPSSQAMRERSRGRPPLAGALLERLERVEDPVVLEVEVRVGAHRHPRARRRLLAAAVLPGQPAARERAVRRVAEPFPDADPDRLLLVLALEQGVGVLGPVRTAVPECFLEPGGVDVAAAVGPDPALFDELRRRCRSSRRPGRPDPWRARGREGRVDAEARQARLDLAPDPLSARDRCPRPRPSG